MGEQQPARDDEARLENTLQLVIRMGLILTLAVLCFATLRPLLVTLIWGVIIAVATHPFFVKLQVVTGDRRTIAAMLYAAIALLVLIVPTWSFAETLFEAIRDVSRNLADGVVDIPPPGPEIKSWPVVGGPIGRFWELASEDLEAALNQIGPQLRSVSTWLLTVGGRLAVGIAKFVLAILTATALLANAKGGERIVSEISARLVGPSGPIYADLARATIRSVAHGIVGVALLQSALAGAGFLVVGIPGAGLLALLCLVLAVVQVGCGPVLLYAVAYQFYTAETTSAVLFTIWCVLVFFMDNVLKPMVLGRGVRVPTLVIFIGSIGGLLSSGFLGLFVGPVVLALGHTVFMTWLRRQAGDRDRDSEEVQATA